MSGILGHRSGVNAGERGKSGKGKATGGWSVSPFFFLGGPGGSGENPVGGPAGPGGRSEGLAPPSPGVGGAPAVSHPRNPVGGGEERGGRSGGPQREGKKNFFWVFFLKTLFSFSSFF